MATPSWARGFPVDRCTACDKGCYPSRKHARAAARRHHPGEHKQAYRCPHNPAIWHYGRLDYPKLRGIRGHHPQRTRRPPIPRALTASITTSSSAKPKEVTRRAVDGLYR